MYARCHTHTRLLFSVYSMRTAHTRMHTHIYTQIHCFIVFLSRKSKHYSAFFISFPPLYTYKNCIIFAFIVQTIWKHSQNSSAMCESIKKGGKSVYVQYKIKKNKRAGWGVGRKGKSTLKGTASTLHHCRSHTYTPVYTRPRGWRHPRAMKVCIWCSFYSGITIQYSSTAPYHTIQ